MADKIKQHDFIEVNYTGKFKDESVFDTTNETTAKKHNIFSPQIKYKPTIICVGEKQLIEGLDDALIDKEFGQEYIIELKPEEAFGKKNFKKIKLIPIAEFQKRKIQPQPGMQIDLDGEVGIVKSATGGRIIVNFNHPFAGKEVVYQVKINKKITDQALQLKSFLELTFNQKDLKVTVTENKAEATLPFELPELLTKELSKKLQDLTKLKEIKFKTEKKSS